jgi:small subunit ribosomal protein S5
MAEEVKTQNSESTNVKTQAVNKPADSNRNFRRNTTKVRPKRKREDYKGKGEDKMFDEKIIHIRRVSRMYKGGRRMRLSVFVVIGDRKGTVGLGLGKGPDVKAAQEKAVAHAKKNLVNIKLKNNTIPHDTFFKYGSAKILVKPAAPGTGIVAGSSMRMVAEVAGIKDMLGKILGTNNKVTNAYATVFALTSLRSTRL